MKSSIIVDIDGTLSNSSHRQHFMETTPKDWKSFYKDMFADRPNDWCRLILKNMKRRFWIVLVSGRPSEYREITLQWLVKNDIPFHELHMRGDGDFRPDYVIKKEILDKQIKPFHHDILFCIDDRKQVVDMWRKEGLVCLQCAEGNF